MKLVNVSAHQLAGLYDVNHGQVNAIRGLFFKFCELILLHLAYEIPIRLVLYKKHNTQACLQLVQQRDLFHT